MPREQHCIKREDHVRAGRQRLTLFQRYDTIYAAAGFDRKDWRDTEQGIDGNRTRGFERTCRPIK